jgi:NAD(P)-dependent dehydrogenase (short-subunit alcohol dehydrogenase family)
MFRDRIFDGRTAVITGGGTGLGRAFALRFAELGAKVVLASRSPDHLSPTRDEIRAVGGEAIAVPTDVRAPEQVESLMKTARETYGSIDILINNAAGNFLCRAEKLSYNGWRSVVDIVLNGSFFCCRAVFPHMKEQNYGRILSILATYASGASPGTIHSAAAKSGVQSMMRTLAVEWARYGIHSNAIAPGSFPTEGASSRLWLGSREEAAERVGKKVPVGRHGRHEELANLAAYLCSSYADYINGETVIIDGGAMWNHSYFEWDKME